MDVVDIAQALEADRRDAALRAARAPDHGVGDGTCRCCGNPIPPRRLEALPTALRCAPCQRAIEARGRSG